MLSLAFASSCMLSKGRFTRGEERAVGILLVLFLAGHLLPHDKERLEHCRCLLCPIEKKILEEK